MLIDWFTVGAQVLNFLVLVVLLRRFLYKPILKAIDAREKRIADQLAEAQAQNAEARTLREAFEDKNRAFDDQSATMLAKAAAAAKAEGRRLMVEARESGDAMRASQASQLQGERATLATAITRQVSDEVFAIARKTLAELSSVTLEERMAEVFTQRLAEIDADTRTTLSAALSRAGNKAHVCSRFTLDAAPRAAIRAALSETFSAEVEVEFEAGEGVGGIELNVGGQKLAWSINDYLSSLQDQLGVLLDKQAQPADAGVSIAAPPPKAESA